MAQSSGGGRSRPLQKTTGGCTPWLSRSRWSLDLLGSCFLLGQVGAGPWLTRHYRMPLGATVAWLWGPQGESVLLPEALSLQRSVGTERPYVSCGRSRAGAAVLSAALERSPQSPRPTPGLECGHMGTALSQLQASEAWCER